MPLSATRRFLVALAAVATAASAGVLVAEPAMAGTSTGTVTGHVVATDGSPAAGVPVQLVTDTSDADLDHLPDPKRVHTYTVATNDAGEYTVSGVQQGVYAQNIAPSSVWASALRYKAVTLRGGVALAPTITAVRLATIHGTLEASENGAPIAGAEVTLADTTRISDPWVFSVADGGFTIHAAPGQVEVQVSASGRFATTRTVTVAEGQDSDLGAVPLDPSGTITTKFLGGSGHVIDPSYEAAVVDGCRLDAIHVSTCRGAELSAFLGTTSLQLTPGAHTVRYEVRGPSSSTVRRVTRSVVVQQGETRAVAAVVVKADPRWSGAVSSGSYRRGHAVSVHVVPPSYIDNTRPHLRTTFLVNGHAVTPTSTTWRASKGGSPVLVARIASKWSTRATLSVRAVVHGTAAYATVTTKATTLTRTK